MSRLRLPAKVLFACAVLGLSAALVLGTGVLVAGASQRRAAGHGVLTLSLSGVVDPFMASYVERGIQTAGGGGYDALALTIDTPGGLDSSMRDIVRAILRSRVPVVCFTPPGARAASAGTFIMLACQVNGMAPGSNIGAAHPVGVSGVIEQAKVTNDAVAYIRSLAQRQGRNADWAASAVRNSVSVDAGEALRLHVVDFVAPSLPVLLAEAGGCAPGSTPPPATRPAVCGDGTRAFHESVGEGFFHAFADPDIAFLLLDIAFVALIIWAFHPGFHVPLAVGVVCLAVGLAILETLPVRLAGLSLLFVAAVLFVLDLKAKAHGVLTAGGIVVFILGGLLLFNPAVPEARVSPWLLFTLPLAVGVVGIFAVRAVRAARKRPLQAGPQTLVGTIGVAESALDPLGRVHVRGESWSAESVGGPVPAGAQVLVLAVKGLKLEVFPESVPSIGDRSVWRLGGNT
jgi:membrane-bound serine protease (ClpP class)